MVARRIERPGRERITLYVDDEEVTAVRGEPVAMSLFAADKLVLGRSVKYHRPRGAVCFSGRCDGCLLRVDGVPSVRTCRLPAAHGAKLETQNVWGSAELDLLSAADWFFPGGMNHHEMFTWARPVNEVMQRVAREIAGIGTLPDAAATASPVTDEALDALVLGAGAAGLTATRVLAERGLRVRCIDEDEHAGGWLRFASQPDAQAHAATLLDAASRAGAVISTRHAALGSFEEPGSPRLVLVEHEAGLLRVHPRAVIVAVGRSEGAAAFEGSDLPGVIGAEGAARLLAHDIVPGAHVVVVGDLTTRRDELEALATRLRALHVEVEGPHGLADIVRADGRARISSVTLRRAGARTKLACDLLIVGPRTSANHELAVQSGARTALREGVFELVHTQGAGATWIVGGAGGARTIEDAIAQAEAAAGEILRKLEADEAKP